MKKYNPRKNLKADLFTNDKEEVENMIVSYKQNKNEEIPLRINEKTIIMVPPEKCNERYKQKYIKKQRLR